MKPNIVFILLDGARWDRLNKSQEFSELIKEGTLLDNVNTAIPYTIGSVNVTFSGLYGKENGIDAYYKMFRLKKSIKNLPEILHENGYFTACDLLTDKIIVDRGFDIHQAHNEYEDNLLVRHPKLIDECIKKAEDKPIFLFLHSTKIHTVTVSEILKKYQWDDKTFYENKERNLENYDKVFQEVGQYTAKIKDYIDNSKLKNNTIIVFFSDHGTGVGERFGERNYGSFTYEETIRSFYLFIGEKIKKNIQTSNLRETIDIMPTILDFCEISKNIDYPGENILPFLFGQNEKIDDKEYVFSETGALHGPYPSPKEPNVFCIKNSKYKLMYLKTPDEWKFFDLEKDPDELSNIYDEKLEIIEEFKIKLLNWINRESSIT
jgi:arylsulfatase A-like enzyme